MAPPVEKKKKHSSADHRFISSSATIGENQQQSLGSFVAPFGGRRSVRVAKKMNKRILRKIWICSDIWLNILPFFDHAELGLKMALISPRFVALVDKHFDGTPELTTLWRRIIIRNNIGPKAKLSVLVGAKFVAFRKADSGQSAKFCCLLPVEIDAQLVKRQRRINGKRTEIGTPI